MAKRNNTITIRAEITMEANVNIENIKYEKRLEGKKMSKNDAIAYMLLNYKDKK